MKNLILILGLLMVLPANAEPLKGTVSGKALTGGAAVSEFTTLNNQGLDRLQDRDYVGAESLFRRAYQRAVLERNGTRMRTSLGNLATLFQITGRADEQGRIQAQLQAMDAPVVTAGPCNGCMDLRINAAYAQQLTVQDNQQAFDRTTFREDQSFQLQAQREALEQEKRDYQEMLNRRQERAAEDQWQAQTRAMQGTSYFSKY